MGLVTLTAKFGCARTNAKLGMSSIVRRLHLHFKYFRPFGSHNF